MLCPLVLYLYSHHVCTVYHKLNHMSYDCRSPFFKLTAVHLVDSHYCADPAKFISVLCTSLSTMLHVELPHVNILSKMDLIEQYGKLGKTGISLEYTSKCITLIYRGNIL